MEEKRAEELLAQVESINKILQHIRIPTQTPRTPNTSGLTLPVQISIDTSTGCEQIEQSQLVHFVGVSLSSIPYFTLVSQ